MPELHSTGDTGQDNDWERRMAYPLAAFYVENVPADLPANGSRP